MLLFIPPRVCRATLQLNVSIHLMLLFIHTAIFVNDNRFKFQYISCYSLSTRSVLQWREKFVSIHLMLLFIRTSRRKKDRQDDVSIHLMLLFIEDLRKFNENIHVSIHLMLLFIGLSEWRSTSPRRVSIHLMLLFI